LHEMKQALEGLEVVSAERLRDELFRILAGPQPASALQALEVIGAFEYFLPELSELKGVGQSAPHVADVWSHTLDTLRKLETLLSLLEQDYDADKSGSLWMGLATLRLGRFREQISAHLRTLFVPDRALRPLLFMAALYHDVAKPRTRFVDEHGRVRFFNHDSLGATVVQTRASSLHLSTEEIARLTTIVRHHLRPVLLSQAELTPSRKAIYRFFRHTGIAGVDICLLSLADVMATYGAELPRDVWIRHLDCVRALLEAWWEHPQESVSPPPLLNGHELMDALNLPPGRQVGEILESIQEGQATGQISDREGALALARALLDSKKIDYG
jgi:tRNA nucleotidyltransferase/poly(A) polymerase